MRNTLSVVLFSLVVPGAGSALQRPGAAVPVPVTPPLPPAPVVAPTPPLPPALLVLASSRGSIQLPESFAPQDPADSLWRRGRSLLNRGEHRDAAEVFRTIHTDSRYAGSAYRPGSYYYEAFALSRIGSTDGLRRALTLLTELREQYPRDRYLRDADQLEAHINGELARRGDPEAATELREQAEQGAAQEGPCPGEDDGVRIVALNALLQMNSDQAVPILREVLAQRDACSAELRERAIFVLSQKRGEGLDQVLLEAVRNDPDPEVREAAVFWLSQVNTPEVVAALEEILRTSRDSEVLKKALFALSQNRTDRAQAVLRGYASRDDVPVNLRGTAIQWITQQRSAENLRFLRELYGRIDDEDLKGKIMFAVAQSGDPESLDWLVGIALSADESIEVRKSALFHASMQGDLSTSRLAELYDRAEDRELREHVIFLLSQHSRDRAAVDKLMAIARDETDEELQGRAIFWLGQTGDPRVAEFLLGIIKR